MKRFIYSFFATLILAAGSISVAYAQDYGLEATRAKLGYQAGENIYTLLGRYTGIGLSMIAFVFFGMMLYAGIRWMTARGNEELITKAKDALTAGIIGVIVIAASYGLTTFIFTRLGGQAPAASSQSQAAATTGCCVHLSTADNTVTKCDSITQAQCTPLADLEQTQWHQGSNCQTEPSCKPLATAPTTPSGACYAKTDCYNAKNENDCIAILCSWKVNTCVDFSAPGNATCVDFDKPSTCGSNGCVWVSDSPLP